MREGTINKECYVGIQFIQTMFKKVNGSRSPRVLDWSTSIGYYDEDCKDGLYQDYINTNPDYFFGHLMQINYLGEEPFSYKDEYTEINSLSINELKEGYYDYIIIRECIGNDNIHETIKKASKYLNEDGYLYIDVIDNWIIDKIIKTAEDIGIYPISIVNLYVDYDISVETLLEFGDRVSDETRKFLRMLGYTSVLFSKVKRDSIFAWVYDYTNELIDGKDSSGNELDYHIAELKVYLTLQALFFQNLERNWGNNKTIEEGLIIPYRELNEIISRIKNIHNGMQKIYFRDYFELVLPRYKKYSDLNTKDYYYLSQDELIHWQIDNYINTDYKGNTYLPELELRKIILEQLGTYYKIIDKEGNELPEVERKIFDDRDYPSQELHSYNNISLNNRVDIESTIIYNLMEIRPKSEVSIDYLKYFFYSTGDQKELNEHIIKDLSGVNDKYIRNKNPRTLGSLAIDSITYKALSYNDPGDWHRIDKELLKEGYILIDPIHTHDVILKEFKAKLEIEQRDKYLPKVALRFSKDTIFRRISNLEDKIKALPHKKDIESVTGVLSRLADGEREVERSTQEQDNKVNISGFLLALEVYLRLRVATCERKGELELDSTRITDFGRLSLGNLIHVLKNKNNFSLLYKKEYYQNGSIRISKLIDSLYAYLKIRNDVMHHGMKYQVQEADKMATQICSLIFELDDIMTDALE